MIKLLKDVWRNLSYTWIIQLAFVAILVMQAIIPSWPGIGLADRLSYVLFYTIFAPFLVSVAMMILLLLTINGQLYAAHLAGKQIPSAASLRQRRIRSLKQSLVFVAIFFAIADGICLIYAYAANFSYVMRFVGGGCLYVLLFSYFFLRITDVWILRKPIPKTSACSHVLSSLISINVLVAAFFVPFVWKIYGDQIVNTLGFSEILFSHVWTSTFVTNILSVTVLSILFCGIYVYHKKRGGAKPTDTESSDSPTGGAPA